MNKNWYRLAQEDVFETEDDADDITPEEVELVKKHIWQYTPYGKALRRENMLIEGIKDLAEKYEVGPVDTTRLLRIDAKGDLMMLQKRNGNDYVQAQRLLKVLQILAKKYNGGYGPGISGRWIELNHFVCEKLLTDEGLLPPEFDEFG